MCGCDGESPKAFYESVRIARKQHKCCECGSTIDPGEKYEHVKGLWYDDWEEFKTCMTCANIRNAANKDDIRPSLGCLYATVGSEYEHVIKDMSNETI